MRLSCELQLSATSLVFRKHFEQTVFLSTLITLLCNDACLPRNALGQRTDWSQVLQVAYLGLWECQWSTLPINTHRDWQPELAKRMCQGFILMTAKRVIHFLLLSKPSPRELSELAVQASSSKGHWALIQTPHSQYPGEAGLTGLLAYTERSLLPVASFKLFVKCIFF